MRIRILKLVTTDRQKNGKNRNQRKKKIEKEKKLVKNEKESNFDYSLSETGTYVKKTQKNDDQLGRND